MIKTYDGSSFKRVGGQQGDRAPQTGFTRLRVVYTATGGETSINLANLNSQFSYTPGAAQLEVKRSSGGAMIAGVDFTELTTTTIGFPSTDPLIAGEIVEVTRQAQIVGVAAVQPRPDAFEATGTAGQTVITANFSWPYNATPCAIRVFIHGARQRRAVDFTEVSLGTANTNQIQLVDALVGGENIIIEPWYVPVDQTAAATTYNSQQLAGIQSALTSGTQGFIDQNALISVPASAIVNRAKIPDISADFRASLGVDRIAAQQIYQIQNEFGPNGEPVWGVMNDDRGLIRFVGSWSASQSTGGNVIVSTTVNDYLEVAFYGTGLNLAMILPASTDIRVSVDGGAEGSNIYPSNSSLVLFGRNYAPNTIYQVASGLALGIHTVKLRLASTAGVNIQAIEVINANASGLINVNPGTAYVAGQKISALTAASTAYNSGFESGTLGTRGGRVVIYGKPDGTIAKAVTPANASSATLASADHTNEELVRTYHFREFGAGRTDDFSTNMSAANRAFTLDDGTTTLVANSITSQVSSSQDTISFDQNGSYVTFTFVGTGLDITQVDSANGGSDSYNISIDGGAAIALPTAGSTAIRNVKLVSGLSYGTHTVKITRVTAATWGLRIINFKVYQPKKPTVPANCIELADYNVMANYASTSGAPVNNVSSGVLRKLSTREITYVGTWSAVSIDTANFEGGFNVNTVTNGSYLTYTFFGTGIEWGGYTANAAENLTISIDGVTGLSGYTVSLLQPGTGLSINSSTGVLSGTSSTSGHTRLQISGLPLGIHTLKIQQNTTTVALYADSFDVITPIHSHKSNVYADLQNTLPVGSQAISDNRKTSMVKESLISTKAWAQALGAVFSPTTTSSTQVPMPDMSVTVRTGADGKPSTLRISFSCEILGSASGLNPNCQVYVNGASVGRLKDMVFPGGGQPYIIADTLRIPVAPGVHKVDVYWATSGGTLTANGDRRNLLVEEV